MRPAFSEDIEEKLRLAARIEIDKGKLTSEEWKDDATLLKFASRASRYTHPSFFAGRHRNVAEDVKYANYKPQCLTFLRSPKFKVFDETKEERQTRIISGLLAFYETDRKGK
jgi:hypothetical protein